MDKTFTKKLKEYFYFNDKADRLDHYSSEFFPK